VHCQGPNWSGDEGNLGEAARTKLKPSRNIAQKGFKGKIQGGEKHKGRGGGRSKRRASGRDEGEQEPYHPGEGKTRKANEGPFVAYRHKG